MPDIRQIALDRLKGAAQQGSSPTAGVGGTAQSLLDQSRKWSEAVSAANFAQANKQMQFQERANAKAMAYNAEEAEKARNWQERMSNTAHQREVQDLISAGLNPILSATGGNGAAVTSGAAASGVTSAGAKGDADASAAQTLSSVAAGLIQQMTQQQLQVKDLENKMDIAQLQTDVQRYLGELSAATGLEGVGISANAARAAAAMAAAASRYSSDTQYNMYRDFPSSPWRLISGNTGYANSAKSLITNIWKKNNPEGDSFKLFHDITSKLKNTWDKAKIIPHKKSHVMNRKSYTNNRGNRSF